MEGRLRL